MATSTAQDHIERAQEHLRVASAQKEHYPEIAAENVARAVAFASAALVDVNARIARLEEAVKALSWGKADA